jgi:hypothetical protein
MSSSATAPVMTKPTPTSQVSLVTDVSPPRIDQAMSASA